MEIYRNLPPEIQAKVKYYVLSHPTAVIIREKISELRCDEFFTFRDQENRIFCKVDGRDFFADEYFSRIKKPKHYDLAEAEESDTSGEYLDEVFERIFNVSSSTSSDDEG